MAVETPLVGVSIEAVAGSFRVVDIVRNEALTVVPLCWQFDD